MSPSGAATSRRQRHRLDIEGMRCVAIVTVVLYHAGVPGFGGGFVGVDVFFVLSGFLITDLLWREVSNDGNLSFARFYARRARRILPVSTLVIVVTALWAWRVVPPLELPAVMRSGLASALFVENIRLAASHTSYLTVNAPSAFQQYWSLGVEEQFYLVWPVVLLAAAFLGRRGERSRGRAFASVALLSVVSLVGSWWLTRVDQPWAFFSLPTRAWELGVGALLALGWPWVRRLPGVAAGGLGWVGLAAVGYASWRLSSTTPYPGLAAVVPVAGCAAVVAAGTARHAWGVERLLGLRPFRFFGRISYALYLWHWPLLVLAPLAVGHALSLGARSALVLVAVGLSAVTVVVVEAPVRFSPRLAAPRRALAAGAVFVAVAVAVTVALPVPVVRGTGVAVALPPTTTLRVVARKTVDPRLVRLQELTAQINAAVAASMGTRDVPSNLEPALVDAHDNASEPFLDGCLASFTATEVGSCTYGSSHPVATVVVYGDSHAAMWYPALDSIANARAWRLDVFTKATCPPLQTPVFAPNFGREYRECDEFRANALARIAALRPNLVILDMNRAYGPAYELPQYGPAWLEGLAATIHLLRSDGAQVLVIGPVPHPVNDVPDCLSENLDRMTNCNEKMSDAYDLVGMAHERATVVSAGGHYLDVRPWFCTSHWCAVVVGNLLVYRDENHLTTYYAAWLAPAVAAEIDLLRAMPASPPPEPTVTTSTTIG